MLRALVGAGLAPAAAARIRQRKCPVRQPWLERAVASRIERDLCASIHDRNIMHHGLDRATVGAHVPSVSPPDRTATTAEGPHGCSGFTSISNKKNSPHEHPVIFPTRFTEHVNRGRWK